MDIQELEKLVGPAERALNARRVFAEPLERDGVTVIPAAAVRGGGGGGGGTAAEGKGAGTGTGFGLTARPVGAFVIRAGKLGWRPAVDVNRVILGAQILGGLALILAFATLRRSKGFAPRLRFGRR